MVSDQEDVSPNNTENIDELVEKKSDTKKEAVMKNSNGFRMNKYIVVTIIKKKYESIKKTDFHSILSWNVHFVRSTKNRKIACDVFGRFYFDERNTFFKIFQDLIQSVYTINNNINNNIYFIFCVNSKTTMDRYRK